MNSKKASSLRNNFLIMLLGFTMMILVVFLSYHSLVTSYANRNASENLSYILQQLYKNIDKYFVDADRMAFSLASENVIQDFLQEGSPERYALGDKTSDSVNAITFNPDYTISTIIYDNEGSFYRYNIGFSNDTCHQIFQKMSDKQLNTQSVITVGNASYYATHQDVYRISGTKGVKLGTILLLGNLATVDDMISEYDSISGLNIVLWNDDELVLSNRGLDPSILKENMAENVLISSRSFPSNDFTLVVYMENEIVFPYNSIFITGIIIVLICTLLFFLLFLFLANRLIISPITKLIVNMQQLKATSPESRLPDTNSTIINMMVYDINALLDRTEAYRQHSFKIQEKNYELELKKRKMELHYFRKSINSHLIFNTLSTIKVLLHQAEQDTLAKGIECLAILIRYTHRQEEFINFFDELRIIEKYVYIMNIQNKKLHVNYEVHDSLLSFLILKQLLQPIVENAFVHGFKDKDTDCRVEIKATKESEQMRITIKDNGSGISPEELKQIELNLAIHEDSSDYDTEGIALTNINRRIKLHFGDDYGLSIKSEVGIGTTVSITFPLIKDKKFD